MESGMDIYDGYKSIHLFLLKINKQEPQLTFDSYKRLGSYSLLKKLFLHKPAGERKRDKTIFVAKNMIAGKCYASNMLPRSALKLG